MLIKNTKEDFAGQLYTFLVIGAKSEVKSFKKSPDEISLVNIKNGKSEGTKTFAQTSSPLYATTLYLAGFIVIKTNIKSKQIGTI